VTWKLPGWLDRILPHVNIEGTLQAEPQLADDEHLQPTPGAVPAALAGARDGAEG
jgi:hypothetical protein